MVLTLPRAREAKKKENKPENEATVPNSGVQEDMDKQQNQINKPGQDVDFSVPWSANVSYTLTYNKPGFTSQLVQSASVRGDLSLTKKWKIGASTGYDFKAHKVTTTSLNIFRDLHCWEMRLSIVPFGQYQSYSFSINVKSAILHDLKYNKNKSWVDNF